MATAIHYKFDEGITNADQAIIAAPELFNGDKDLPLAFTAAELIAMQGHEWSWQFSTAKGLSIYAITATTETINKARRYHHLDLIYPRLAWGIGYSAGLHSLYGPEPAFASSGGVPDGAGGVLPQNTLPVDATGRGVYCGPGDTNAATTSDTDFGVTVTNLVVNASRISPNSTNGEHYKTLSAISYVSGTIYSLSCKVKYDGHRWFRLSFGSGAFPAADRSAHFDLLNGVVGSKGATCASAISALDIDGYYTVQLTRVATGSATEVSYIALIPSDVSTSYVGDGVNGVYVKEVMRVASPYLFPYIPPGTTVTSCAGTSGDNGTRWTMDDGMLECLRGETDGTELWSNASASGTNWALATGAWTHTAGSTAVLSIASVLTLTNRYLANYSVTGRTAGSITARAGSSGTGGTANTTNASFKEELTCAGSTDIQFVPTTDFNGVVTVTSIQRLLPSRCTVAALVTMGVGSGELAAGVASNFLSWKNSATDLKFGDSSGTKQIATLTDGATTLEQASAWDRYIPALISFRTNQAGTYYQLGYRRIGVDSAMVWGSPGVYDGSLNPGSVLRSALNGTLPLWKKSMQVWDRPVTDAAIYDWAITRLGGGA